METRKMYQMTEKQIAKFADRPTQEETDKYIELGRKMNTGDRIRIISGPWASDCGTIEKIRSCGMLLVKTDTQINGLASVHPSDVTVIREPRHEQEYHGEMGIGGIGIYSDNEMPVIPSEAAIKRVQKMHDTDVICRRCGASKNFDGAMFTTCAGSNICDDCF